MSKAAIQPWAIGVTFALLVMAALGYLISPSAMLSVVGIEVTPVVAFLTRTLAAAFLGLLPMTWVARQRAGGGVERAVLLGLGVYMVAGSAVDIHAYLSGLVGFAAVPSGGLRTILGLVLFWLAVPD